MEEQIIKNLAAKLDEKIRLRGLLEVFDGLIIEQVLLAGYRQLKKFDQDTATEFAHLAETFLVADKNGMVDEAADLLAAIVKKLFISTSI